MEIYQGMVTFHGIAIGKIQYYHKKEQSMLQYTAEKAQKEQKRLKKALQLVEEERQSTVPQSFVKAMTEMIRHEKVNAGTAVETTRDELLHTFAALEDERVRSWMEDLREIADRLLAVLEELPREPVLAEPVIVVSREMAPTNLIELEKDKILGIVTKEGSRYSHTTILAKTMNVPAMIQGEADADWDGRMAILDGSQGKLYLDPDEALLQKYQEKKQQEAEEQKSLQLLKEAEDVTLDGTRVGLLANIGKLDDLKGVLASGAAGIGLLRSEFQYLGREEYPRERELYQAYCEVAEAMEGKPVIIRTVDLGADKKSDYMEFPEEENPLMGNRGIRLCLDQRQMFKSQLRALYRASVHGNLLIMYPMITSIEEVYQIQEMIEEVKLSLKKQGIPYGEVKQGIMIETPAAAFISRELAEQVDFISLGTNDLTQYLLAMDRENPALKGKYDEHHPAVFSTISMVVKKTHQAGKKVLLCGELAGETEMIPRLLQMGVDGLSVVPASVLTVRRAIRETRLSKEGDQA